MSRKIANTGPRLRPVHSGRLERFVGRDRLEYISGQFRDWYGPPVHILDLPGSVRVCGGGDFIGPFDFGFEASWGELMAARVKRFWRDLGRYQPAFVGAGFASISDALARASSGDGQRLNGGMIAKSGPTGVASSASSLWRVGTMPAAGAAGSAAPGGRAPTDATTGAMAFNNPSSGTLHLTGAQFAASVVNNAVCVYDRIFDVDKTMNSTATEAVTGVPTRYQSTTSTAADYAGGNFLFIEVGGTALAATAHNWTTCTYSDQADAASTLPSVTGNSGAIVDRFDMPVHRWFCPLESGDVGIKELTQMQCSAAVATGAINFVIGHPIGIMLFPIAGVPNPFSWLTGPELAPRIFDDAALALFEFPKPSTTATTYSGILTATRAAP